MRSEQVATADFDILSACDQVKSSEIKVPLRKMSKDEEEDISLSSETSDIEKVIEKTSEIQVKSDAIGQVECMDAVSSLPQLPSTPGCGITTTCVSKNPREVSRHGACEELMRANYVQGIPRERETERERERNEKKAIELCFACYA